MSWHRNGANSKRPPVDHSTYTFNIVVQLLARPLLRPSLGLFWHLGCLPRGHPPRVKNRELLRYGEDRIIARQPGLCDSIRVNNLRIVDLETSYKTARVMPSEQTDEHRHRNGYTHTLRPRAFRLYNIAYLMSDWRLDHGTCCNSGPKANVW